jgi:hypothetical protein
MSQPDIYELARRISRLEGALIDKGLAPKPETWRDVTAECDKAVNLSGDLLIVRKGGFGAPTDTVLRKEDGYRLRKVRLYWGSANQIQPQEAFIVERKDP